MTDRDAKIMSTESPSSKVPTNDTHAGLLNGEFFHDPDAGPSAAQLYDCARPALDITGTPDWPSADVPDTRESLLYFDDDPEPTWALVPQSAPDDYLPIHPALARCLIDTHLTAWLAHSGWQVQMWTQAGQTRWRLADCLAITDGGGDRLDADYPIGPDRFAVLCRSVHAVAASARP